MQLSVLALIVHHAVGWCDSATTAFLNGGKYHHALDVMAPEYFSDSSAI